MTPALHAKIIALLDSACKDLADPDHTPRSCAYALMLELRHANAKIDRILQTLERMDNKK